MKLVDILARELKVWPEGMEAAYSSGHLVRFCTELGTSHSNVLDIGLEPEDQASALVTRGEWQAAVDAIYAYDLDIDWNSQPSGFPLWLEGTTAEYRKNSGWYREIGQVFVDENGGQWRSCREGQFFTVHRKPETVLVEWEGEGEPPVGIECEWHSNVCGWVKVKILGRDGADTWYRASGEEHSQTCRNMAFFRPIRTAEQVAAEEWDKARTEALNAMTANGKTANEPEALWKFRLKVLGEMLDMGYRKK